MRTAHSDKRQARIATLATILLLVCSSAQSQESAKAPQAKAPNGKQRAAPDQRGTQAAPLIVDVLPPKNADEIARYHRNWEEQKGFHDKLIAYGTIALSAFTLFLFIYTACLWRATVRLGRDAKRTSDRQAVEMEKSLAIARDSADAAVVTSMPVLSPLVVGGTLHPLTAESEAVTFDAYVQFVFENFGKTPAIIRELRAELFLNEMDEFPVVQFENLPLISYEPIVAGESRGQAALIGVAECKKQITLAPIEQRELLAEATGKYRRFALIGQVIYDDFFQGRHTRRFCLKMRRMGETGLFQLVRGGRAYNHVDREKLPSTGPARS